MKKALVGMFTLAASIMAGDLVFTIGEWPPYTGQMEKEYGTTAKKVKDICAKANLTCDFEFMPWKRAYAVTNTGKAAGTFPWEVDDSHKDAFIFSPTIEKTEIVVFHTKPIPEGATKDLKLLGNSDLVGVAGYTTPENIKNMGVKIHMVNSSELAWKMIEMGRMSAFVDDKQVGMSECKLYTPSICDKLTVSEPILTSPMVILFSRVADEKVSENIKKFMEAMK